MKALKALLIGLTLLCPASAMAQDFPNKPIRLIVPFPPGGPNDLIGRVIGQRMSEILKQSIVDRKPLRPGRRCRHRCRRQVAARRLHHRHYERGRAGDQPEHGEGFVRDAQGSAADHPRRQGAGDAGGGHQRSCQQHERAGRSREFTAGQAQLRVVRSRQPAAPRRRIVQAHRQDQHRARALPRGGSRRE